MAKKSHFRAFNKKWKPLLWLLVIIPTLCSTVYFSFFASDIYISQSSFVVRSPKNQASLSGIGAILQSSGFARAQDDTYTVQEFIRSRTALAQLEKTLPVKQFYQENGDFFSRFDPLGWFPEQEAFYQYFQKKQSINFDTVSGIATLNIRAFDPAQAQQISVSLLKQGENFINQLNERARKDTIFFAKQAVEDAEKRVNQTASALSKYRINKGVFDLQSQSEVQTKMISTMQSELINIQTQLEQLRAVAPNNPQVKTLIARERSLKSEMQKQVNQVLGGGNSLASQSAEYQRLMLDNTLAEQQLATAITSLQNTKAESERQQLYLEVISEPSKPDLALEPYRLYNILATFFIGLILYGVVSLLMASVREHKN
ncbi:MAG: capsule biosynthesis protein [Pasteurella oralis]|uniref:capsule biosynthesis protein n=1 Tax=Pasteurella oralis TaxID=1071947 RepID=UPI002701E873|nr:capsule biosynthesis protein [Pasteurella oralis]